MSKDKYKVTNWSSYNAGLKQRGSLTLWVDTEVAFNWHQLSENKRGGQKVYSALAIETCLVLGKVYHLPLRQTEGFVKSIFILLRMESSQTRCRQTPHLDETACSSERTNTADRSHHPYQ